MEERKAAALEKLRSQQADRASVQQNPTQTKTSITLDVKSGATGHKQNDTWKTDWGSYNRDIDSRRSIECSVSLFGTPKTVRLLCYFFGDREGLIELGKSGARLDFERPGNQSQKFECSAMKHVDNYAALGAHYERGDTVKSWIVQAYVDGKLVAWRSSDNGSKLEAVAKMHVAEKKELEGQTK